MDIDLAVPVETALETLGDLAQLQGKSICQGDMGARGAMGAMSAMSAMGATGLVPAL
jgi:hypothetical protein